MLPDLATAWTENVPPLDTGLKCDVAIVCESQVEAAGLARGMNRSRKQHFGMFEGYVGRLAGRDCVIIVSGGGEKLTHVATRQVAWLGKPRMLVNFSSATAVSERLRTGDVALVSTVQRCYCPVVIANNMFHDDELVWPDNEMRSHVEDSPTLTLDAGLATTAQKAIESNFPAGLNQPGVHVVAGGSMERPVATFRGAEWMRKRFAIELVDAGGYGYVDAARFLANPAMLMLKIIAEDCTGEKLAGRRLRKGCEVAAATLELAIAATIPNAIS